MAAPVPGNRRLLGSVGRQVSLYDIAKLHNKMQNKAEERAHASAKEEERAQGQQGAGAGAAGTAASAGGAPAASTSNLAGSSGKDGALTRSAAESVKDLLTRTGSALTAATAVVKMKGKAEKVSKGRFFLRMNPTESEHPPAGLPVREVLQQIYNHRRDRTVRDLFFYLLYVGIFLGVVYAINNTQDAYASNAAVYNTFLDEELEGSAWQKTFFDINNFEDISTWMTTVFSPGMYPTEHRLNGANLTADEADYIQYYLRKVGGARLWLVRVSNTSCETHLSESAGFRKRFGNPNGACYGRLVPGVNVETRPFGPPGDPTKYRYYEPLSSPIEGLSGWGEPSYGNGGYIVYLPNDPIRGPAIIEELIEDGFLDEQMRALAVDFNLFNSDTNQLVVTRIIIEFQPTGLILTSYKMYTMKMLLYESTIEKLRAAGEAVVAAGSLYYLITEIRQLLRSRPWYKYFKDWSNTFDLTLQTLMLCCIIFWAKELTSPERVNFDINAPCLAETTATPNAYGVPTCFKDMIVNARNYVYALTFAGFLGLLMALKFFKYFSLSRRMNSLWLTLAHAGRALVAFIFGFGLLVAGFAFLAQMCFGAVVSHFHSFESSFSTLLRYPLGDFNYRALSQARPDIAPIFFVLYMALVFLVCMNMVVAIITISFEEVSRANQVEEKWKHAVRTVSMEVSNRFHRYMLYLRRVARYTAGVCKCCSRKRNAAGAGPQLPPGVSDPSLVNRRRKAASAASSTTSVMTVRRPSDQKLIYDSIEAELAAYQAENAYLTLMGAFIQAAEEISHRDLLKYMEEIHKSCPPEKNLYVGLNELCTLVRNPDDPVDPFCAVGHRWRALGAFVLNQAKETNLDLELLAAEESWVGRTFGLRCFRAWRSTKTAVKRTVRCYCCKKRDEPIPQRVRQRRADWTPNPLRDEPPSNDASSPDAANGSEANIDPDMVRASYKPRCMAWRLVQAYNSYKDVILLGATDRHAFMSEKAMGTGDEKPTEHLTQLSVKGAWTVTKINRSDIKQRRYISIKEEQPSYFVVRARGSSEEVVVCAARHGVVGFVVQLYCHDMTGRLKRRFPILQIVQLEASIPNARRLFVYIEADAAAAEAAGSDPLAKYAITADTLYDLVFANPSEREVFLNVVMRTRETMMRTADAARSVMHSQLTRTGSFRSSTRSGGVLRSGGADSHSARAGLFARAAGDARSSGAAASETAKQEFRRRSQSIATARELKSFQERHLSASTRHANPLHAERSDDEGVNDDERRASVVSSGTDGQAPVFVPRTMQDVVTQSPLASALSAAAAPRTQQSAIEAAHTGVETDPEPSKTGSARQIAQWMMHSGASSRHVPLTSPHMVITRAATPSVQRMPMLTKRLNDSAARARIAVSRAAGGDTLGMIGGGADVSSPGFEGGGSGRALLSAAGGPGDIELIDVSVPTGAETPSGEP